MLIDPHIHTSRYSRCSILDPRDLIFRTKELNLDGIVITEHNHLWSWEEIEKLKENANVEELVVLRGREIETEIGHLLIYGCCAKIKNGVPLEEILRRVHQEGGVVVLSHPFRYGRYANYSLNRLKEMFSLFDALEVFNSNQSIQEKEKGMEVAKFLNLTAIGGSDSHSLTEIVGFVTKFSIPIAKEENLVKAIKNGKCEPIERVSDQPGPSR